MSMTLSEAFYYDAASPTFLRRRHAVMTGRHHLIETQPAGSVAGNVNADGYVHVRFNGSILKGHNVVWELFNGPVPEGFEVDHEDGSKGRNKIGNLRLTSHAVNTRNGCMRSTNTSGETGVSFHKGMVAWQASWNTLESKRMSKTFRVDRHGLLPAFAMAVKHRRSMIEQLNQQGAGYSERHGT